MTKFTLYGTNGLWQREAPGGEDRDRRLQHLVRDTCKLTSESRCGIVISIAFKTTLILMARFWLIRIKRPEHSCSHFWRQFLWQEPQHHSGLLHSKQSQTLLLSGNVTPTGVCVMSYQVRREIPVGCIYFFFGVGSIRPKALTYGIRTE